MIHLIGHRSFGSRDAVVSISSQDKIMTLALCFNSHLPLFHRSSCPMVAASLFSRVSLGCLSDSAAAFLRLSSPSASQPALPQNWQQVQSVQRCSAVTSDSMRPTSVKRLHSQPSLIEGQRQHEHSLARPQSKQRDLFGLMQAPT
jgi:hypothetical protein